MVRIIAATFLLLTIVAVAPRAQAAEQELNIKLSTSISQLQELTANFAGCDKAARNDIYAAAKDIRMEAAQTAQLILADSTASAGDRDLANQVIEFLAKLPSVYGVSA